MLFHQKNFDGSAPRIYLNLNVPLKLTQGLGKSFSNQMEKLLKILKEEIPKTFGSEEYGKRKQEVMEEHQKKYQAALDAMDNEAKGKNLMVQISPMGAAVVPLVEGKPMSREEFLSLPEAERKAIETRRLEMMRKVDETYAYLHDIEKEVEKKMKEIDLRAGEFAISRPFDELFEAYSEYPEVKNFLKEAREYTLSKLDLFTHATAPLQVPGPPFAQQVDPFLAYKVNVFVDNSSISGPPIVIEPNPNWFNIFGKIERRALMGTYTSDHSMIKPGAVQLANGGYLILNIRDVLLNPGVWEGLKRVIKTKEVRVEDPGEHVEKAAREKIHRLDLVAERIRQMIAEGTIMVDVEGVVAGQVNGLSVSESLALDDLPVLLLKPSWENAV
jgi:predicted ATP-dependent protease